MSPVEPLAGMSVLAAPIHEPVPPAAYSAWVWAVGLRCSPGSPRGTGGSCATPGPPRSRSARFALGVASGEDVGEGGDGGGAVPQRERRPACPAPELNTILREFATERLGRDAMWMTAGEIAKFEGAERISHLLAEYEEPAFAHDTDAQAMAATASAREVISTW